jgi:ubiquinone/menaquinone biosynthesis C-methylase UbiE
MTTTDQGAIVGIDHVQMAIPRGGEEQARAFYGERLGLREVPKPAMLAGRGGVWYDCGAQMLHLGIDPDFQPQRKGHPALLVRGLTALRERLRAAGRAVIEDELLPGYDRFYTADPFGNRLELLEPVGSTATGAEVSSEATEIKDRVREMFGKSAEAYVKSPTHAAGADLALLLEWADPQASDRALDVSTGGGHTALALAAHVGRVTASDLTPRMLEAARAFLAAKGVTNAEFVIADAERLPFLDASFELVTVRIAPHHYADIAKAVREMARVLVPGGRLVVIDNIAPEESALDAYVNRWDTWRDPSHVREYTSSEWRRFVQAAGLRVTRLETQRKAHPFAEWVERMRMPDAERARLEADMLGAPAEVRAYFEIVEQEGHVASWTADYLIALAAKPAR